MRRMMRPGGQLILFDRLFVDVGPWLKRPGAAREGSIRGLSLGIVTFVLRAHGTNGQLVAVTIRLWPRLSLGFSLWTVLRFSAYHLVDISPSSLWLLRIGPVQLWASWDLKPSDEVKARMFTTLGWVYARLRRKSQILRETME